MKILFIVLLLFGCIQVNSDFNIDICASYKNYTEIYGHPGDQGVPSKFYYPSARNNALWTYNKTTNILWIFGGNGYVPFGQQGRLVDLWRYNGNTDEWTWVAGYLDHDVSGHFEQRGEPHPFNIPGSREGGCIWEHDEKIWIWGGYGNPTSGVFTGCFQLEDHINVGLGYLNDLWNYNGEAWTFVSGGEVADNNDESPPPRAYCICWKDDAGNFWIYGGSDVDGDRVDTWKFDGHNWTHISGPLESDIYDPTFGEKRQLSFNFHPRSIPQGGFTSTGSIVYYGANLGSDIWKFDIEKGWGLWDGTVETNKENTGQLKTPAEGNIFGHRSRALMFEHNDYIWIFGGNADRFSDYNDLWLYNQSHFVWMGGEFTPGTYPEQITSGPDQLDYGNYPGSTDNSNSVYYTDNQGYLNIFGGPDKNSFWKIVYGHKCFGKSVCNSPESEICSGNGKCVGTNVCRCNDGYRGADCSEECPAAEIISFHYAFPNKNELILTFSMPMNTQYMPDSCLSAFEDGWKLGNSSQCFVVESPTVYKIQTENRLLIGDTLTLNDNILKDAACGRFIPSQTITLELLGVPKPVAIINAPAQLGECHNLTLESLSYGIGPFSYKWEHINQTGFQYSLEIANLLENESNSMVEIPGYLLTPGMSTKYNLTITDWYGQQDTVSIVVEKEADMDIPFAYIEGELSRTVRRTQGFFIESRATFSPCASASGKKLFYSWTSIPYVELGPSKNSSNLYVPPYLLSAGQQYTFELTVKVQQDGQDLSSTTIQAFVQVEKSPLVAKILGDNLIREISVFSTLELDASNSYDPDDPNAPLSFEWTCCDWLIWCNVQKCLEKFEDLPNTVTPIYRRYGSPQAPLPSFYFEFTVTVRSQDGRSANATAKIITRTQPIPIVYIKDLDTDVHNVERPLILDAIVLSETTGLNYSWSVVEGEIDLSDKSVAPYGTNQLQLYIAGSKLTNSSRYSLRFTATSDIGSGSAWITVNVNQAPFGGILSAKSSQVQSLKDTITLVTSGWIDADLPLKYSFYQQIQTPQGIVDKPLHLYPQSKPEFSFIAPAVEKDTMITFKVVAFDNKNAKGSATTNVHVIALPKEEPHEDLAEKLINENLQFLLSEGNFEKIIQYIHSVSEVLELSNDPNAVQRRKELKKKLIELYREVFQSNVYFVNGDLRISVISTLSNILGKIEEIHTDTFSESIQLISSTFGDTINSATEPLPKEIGQQAVATISNLIESNGFNGESGSDKITKAISQISKLVFIDTPSRTRIEFNSTQIKIVQAREYVNEIVGKLIKNDDSEISVPTGVFDNLDAAKKQSLGVVDIRLFKWNKNPFSYIETTTNISSPVLTADLLDDTGQVLRIENLKNPIQIKLPFKNDINAKKVECKFFNISKREWTNITLASIIEGEYSICATTHLSDFATFIANDEPEPSGFNPNWLWLLLLLIPGIAVVVTVIALFVIICRNKIKKKAETKANLPASPQTELVDVQLIVDSTPVEEQGNAEDGAPLEFSSADKQVNDEEELPELPSDAM